MAGKVCNEVVVQVLNVPKITKIRVTFLSAIQIGFISQDLTKQNSTIGAILALSQYFYIRATDPVLLNFAFKRGSLWIYTLQGPT